MTTIASRLCQSCGLCCNGVLFYGVRVLPSDSQTQLGSLGLLVHQKKREPFFEQPCSAYKNHCCSIYKERPTRCRQFECQQLKRVARGESTESEAVEVIRRAHEKIQFLKNLFYLVTSRSPKGPLLKEIEKALAEPFQEDTSPENLEQRRLLEETFQEFRNFLNTEFRITPY